MNLRKRIFALLMAFTMVLTYMPALAFAETIPADAAPGEETSVSTESDTVDEGLPASEEAEPVVPSSDTAAGTTGLANVGKMKKGKTSVDSGSNDELLMQYLESKLGSGKAAPSTSGKLKASRGRSMGSRLEGNNAVVYGQLKDAITQVAAGSPDGSPIDTSSIAVPVSSLEVEAEDLKVPLSDNIDVVDEDNNLTEDVLDAVFEYVGCNTGTVVDALMADMPYELYWYDKIAGYSYGLGSEAEGVSFSDEPGNKWVSLEGVTLSFSFSVAAEYQDGDVYKVNADKVNAANTAAEKAKEIVSSTSGNAMEILDAYRSQICSLVEYDDTAAASAADVYGDPWQMISVFDDNPDTNVVCEGYSKAFQFLCDNTSALSDAGVECYTVTGNMRGAEATGVGAHMWNIVTIPEDGTDYNYLADITNCDLGSLGEPDKLFLCKAMEGGSVENGYDFDVAQYDEAQDKDVADGESDIHYDYDSRTTGLYDSSTLTLRTESGSSGGDTETAKLIWQYNAPSYISGDAGSNSINGFYYDGNKIIVEYGDGSSEEYSCLVSDDGAGYYLNGDPSEKYLTADFDPKVDVEILNGYRFKEGANEVRLAAYIEDDVIYSDTFTVSGYTRPSYEPDKAVPVKLVWDRGDEASEVRAQTGADDIARDELYVDGYKIIVKYSDGSEKTYICKSFYDEAEDFTDTGYFLDGDASSYDRIYPITQILTNNGKIVEGSENTVRFRCSVDAAMITSDRFHVTGVNDLDPYGPETEGEVTYYPTDCKSFEPVEVKQAEQYNGISFNEDEKITVKLSDGKSYTYTYTWDQEALEATGEPWIWVSEDPDAPEFSAELELDDYILEKRPGDEFGYFIACYIDGHRLMSAIQHGVIVENEDALVIDNLLYHVRDDVEKEASVWYVPGADHGTSAEILDEVVIGGETFKVVVIDEIGFDDEDGDKIPGFTIKGKKGSAAEEYAEENGFTFIADAEECVHNKTTTVRENETAATCTEAGSYEEVVKCSNCGEELSRETKTILALGHDWDEGKITTRATADAEGVMTYTCKRCSHSVDEPIAKIAPELVVNTDAEEAVSAAEAAEKGLSDESSDDDFADAESKANVAEGEAAKAVGEAAKAVQGASEALTAAENKVAQAKEALDNASTEEEKAAAEASYEQAQAECEAAQSNCNAAKQAEADTMLTQAKAASVAKAVAAKSASKAAAAKAAAVSGTAAGTQANVDAAKAAKDAADAAKAAAEAAKAAADEAVKAAEATGDSDAVNAAKAAAAEAEKAATAAGTAAIAANSAYSAAVASKTAQDTYAANQAQAKIAEQQRIAREGIYDPKIPAVKVKKPAAKKNNITAKWKKLTKKQLKKSKATHYEIWVSTSPSYPEGAETKEKIVKKSKASLKVKGLQKNRKYYVRVRAIRYAGGVKYVGKWKQKTIKTRK